MEACLQACKDSSTVQGWSMPSGMQTAIRFMSLALAAEVKTGELSSAEGDSLPAR
jgi:hypothetical protein